jgi:hypothetical protein
MYLSSLMLLDDDDDDEEEDDGMLVGMALDGLVCSWEAI